MTTPVIVPAYQPGNALLRLIEELLTLQVERIVVIDDGSDQSYRPVFEALRQLPGVTVAGHAVNLGKGAALQTGINFALCSWPDLVGVVTADADGQHAPADILAVARRLEAQPDALVLGARSFKGSVPLRSRIGNALTRLIFRLLVGKGISDTQTGLRGIPRSMLPALLRSPAHGYEFELDMLIAAKHQGIAIVETPVSTIYLERNRSSHFNPLRDSMRIYMVLFRFTGVSMMTALLDNTVFSVVFLSTRNLAGSQLAGRLVAVVFQYTATRRAVFHSCERHASTLPKYLALVALSGTMSYLAVRYLTSHFPIQTIPAKVLAESGLFIINFTIQRDWIFTRHPNRSSQQ
ncbi:MAG: glycosyltransferase [Bryobacteraceae bacterium]